VWLIYGGCEDEGERIYIYTHDLTEKTIVSTSLQLVRGRMIYYMYTCSIYCICIYIIHDITSIAHPRARENYLIEKISGCIMYTCACSVMFTLNRSRFFAIFFQHICIYYTLYKYIF